MENKRKKIRKLAVVQSLFPNLSLLAIPVNMGYDSFGCKIKEGIVERETKRGKGGLGRKIREGK